MGEYPQAQTDHAFVPRSEPPFSRRGATNAQVLTLGTLTELVLHGCQVSGMLQNHNSVQSRTDRGIVCVVWYSALSTHRWSCKAYRGMQLPEEGQLKGWKEEGQHVLTTLIWNVLLLLEMISSCNGYCQLDEINDFVAKK